MTHSANNSGMLFSAAALSAGFTGKLIRAEIEELANAQEAKQLAQETQKDAANAMCSAAVQIGQDEYNASIADGWGSIGSGLAMAAAEGVGLGVTYSRSKTTADTTTKLGNNKECRYILSGKNKDGGTRVDVELGDGQPSPRLEAAKERLKNLDPDADLKNYEGGITGFQSDVDILNLDGKDILQSAKAQADKKYKENMKTKQTDDAATERYTGMAKTWGQISGQLATGFENRKRAEAQANRGADQCLSSQADYQKAASQAVADTQAKNVEQDQSVIRSALDAWSSAISANGRA